MFLFSACFLGAVAVDYRICSFFLMYFPNYWEGVVVGLVMDSFYSLPGRSWTTGFGFFTLLSLLILYASSFVKSKIRIFN